MMFQPIFRYILPASDLGLGTCRTYPKIKLPVSWANISLAELEESYDFLWHRPTLALIILVLPVGPAQGGGGTFKDRKGELLWCMGGRANWWTERWLRLWVSLSLSTSTCASRHSRVHILQSLPRHGVSRLLYLFGHLDLVSSDSFSFLTALATDCCCCP